MREAGSRLLGLGAVIAFVTLLQGGSAFAQTPAPAPISITIEQAMRVAEARGESVAIARTGIARAEAERTRAFSEWLPQLNGSVSYDRTLASEFDALFDTPPEGGGAPDGQNGGGTGGIGGGSAVFSELPFGREHIWRAGLSLSQNLYAGGRTSARMRLARIGERSAELGVQQARASAVLEAAQAYYDAVLSDRLLTIAEATLKQAEETADQIASGRAEGIRPEFDLLRARVTADNQRPAVVQRRVERELAMLRLKQLLEIPSAQGITLTSDLEEGALRELSGVAREVADVPAESENPRIPVRQAAQAVEQRETALRIARSGHLPQLDLVSNYGLVNYPDTVLPDFGDWRTNWTVGVVLQVPIFSGFRVSGDIASARADLAEAQLRLRQTEEFVQLDTESAAQQLAAAMATWKASAGTVEQARRAFEIATIRYGEGISTQLELSDARILLDQAQANRARAARDLQLARIRLALLPHLPLTVTVTGAGGASSQAAGASAAGTSMGGMSEGASAAGSAVPASGAAQGAQGGFPGSGR